MEPLGYVMFRVQILYQVVLVVVEDSSFLKKCQVVLGTPTINRAVRAMKEMEIPFSRLGGRVMEPLGYVMFRVQILYQVVLVVVEDSSFLKKCQVVLGTPTINQAVRAMKEMEMECAHCVCLSPGLNPNPGLSPVQTLVLPNSLWPHCRSDMLFPHHL